MMTSDRVAADMMVTFHGRSKLAHQVGTTQLAEDLPTLARRILCAQERSVQRGLER